MRKRSFGLGVLAALLVLLAGGCDKKEPVQSSKQSMETNNVHQPEVNTNAAAVAGPQITARIHWVGKKRLAADTNAVRVLSVWNMPESIQLQAQTLDKLSQAPWRQSNAAPVTVQTSAANRSTLLRPLLDDLVQEEFYLEVREATNHQEELALAVHLNAQQAGLWETNFTGLVSSLDGVAALPPRKDQPGVGFRLTRSAGHLPGLAATSNSQPATCWLTRSGDWTLVSLAAGENSSSLEELLTLIKREGALVNSPATNSYIEINGALRRVKMASEGPVAGPWLEAELDLVGLARALGLQDKLPANLPRVLAAVYGEQVEVRTRATLEFAQPLGLTLETWKLPTNLISAKLAGFGAVRGIAPWIQSFKLWKDLQLGTPPNQACYWAQFGAPNLHFMALPSKEATNQVSKITEYALQELNPRLAPIKLGTFEHGTNLPGLGWHGVPTLSPMVSYAASDNETFLLGAFSPKLGTNHTLPKGLLEQVYSSSKMVWYDWEVTRPCLQGLIPMAQLSRHLADLPRLSPSTAALPWMLAAAAKLGNCVTGLELVSPTQLAFSRSSTIGLTAAEINLLADWLESPRFPFGLHTLEAAVQSPFPLTSTSPTNLPGATNLPSAPH